MGSSTLLSVGLPLPYGPELKPGGLSEVTGTAEQAQAREMPNLHDGTCGLCFFLKIG